MGLDDPLAVGVHPWRPRCGVQDVGLCCAKVGIACGGVLAVAVAWQKSH
jgi:hypothetical protein